MTSIEWFKSLNVNQRIGLKEITIDIVGMSWSSFNILFTPSERLNIIYNKLKHEFNI